MNYETQLATVTPQEEKELKGLIAFMRAVDAEQQSAITRYINYRTQTIMKMDTWWEGIVEKYGLPPLADMRKDGSILELNFKTNKVEIKRQ